MLKRKAVVYVRQSPTIKAVKRPPKHVAFPELAVGPHIVLFEACSDEDGVDDYVQAEIRRLRRLLGLPPVDSSPGMVERRCQQVRERVRRFRERRANEVNP